MLDNIGLHLLNTLNGCKQNVVQQRYDEGMHEVFPFNP